MGGWVGGREGCCAESANLCGVEFRRLRVKVAERWQFAAEFMQRLFPAAPSLCRVQVAPRRGDGSWRGIAEGVKWGT